MNIFEALDIGKNKATLPEMKLYYACQSLADGYIRWIEYGKEPFRVIMQDLIRNDWEPYVPRETEDEKS